MTENYVLADLLTLSMFLNLSYYDAIQLKLVTLLSNIQNQTICIELYVHLYGCTGILLKPLQEQIYTHVNETTLVFFRMYNPTNNDINGITTYSIYPSIYMPYLTKIQCFCFEQLRIKSNESIDLPVLFFLDKEILREINVLNHPVLTLHYTFFQTS